MNTQITFRPGQPIDFTATKTFDLGTTGLKVVKGMEIGFDGTMVFIPGHPQVVMPQLRAALKTGWLVPSQHYNPNMVVRPVSAGMSVRPAEGGNPMAPRPRVAINTSQVESEEREVQSVSAHAAQTRQRNTGNYRRDGGEEVLSQRGFEVIEDQEGTPVRALKTPAKQVTNLEKTNPFTAIQQANNVRIDPGEGVSREEMMAAMDEETRMAYEMERASRIAAYDPEQAAQIVNSVASPGTQFREGVVLKGSVGGGVAVEDLGGTGGAAKAQMTTIEEGGIRFTNTNGPKKNVRLVPTNGTNGEAPKPAQPVSGADGVARQIARSVCPDFPDNYQFGDPVRKKIARLQADFEDRPDVIRAVAAADTDPEVRTRLLEEFPHAFGG